MTEPGTTTALGQQVAERLERWLGSADRYVSFDADGRSWYGAGYPGWGIQTLFPYLGAATMVSRYGATEQVRDWARERAVGSLRYALDSHLSGDRPTTDGRSWGTTWISTLGPERAGFALDLLRPHLDSEDLERLQQMREVEADWLVDSHHRGPHEGVHGHRWGSTGKNWPESNIWNGAHLWRTAEAYPDLPRAGEYRAKAVEFLLNGVSIAADADSDQIVDGFTVADMYRGANFFDSYSLDHHSYLNVGYMVICASNVAMAHFDFQEQGWAEPESLHWRQRELWQAIKPLIGPDGRLIRIGGDSRVRYAYCQEYLLPSLVYAERRHHDPDAAALADAVLRLGMREQDDNEDGSFYGRRLRQLAAKQPYYYVRMETDRALTWAWWLHRAGTRQAMTPGGPARHAPAGGSIDLTHRSVASFPSQAEWNDLEHGFAMVRGPRRFASVAWRAYSLSQTLVLPTQRPDLAEWSMNLSPVLQWEGTQPAASVTESARAHRQLAGYQIAPFSGGFASIARVHEGLDLFIKEGWHSPEGVPAATSTLVVVALPDDATVVGLQLCQAGNYHVPLIEAHGLNLLVPHDVYTPGERSLARIPRESGAAMVVDDALEVQVSGSLEARSFTVADDPALRSISVDQLVADHRAGAFFIDPGAVVLDTAWAVRVTEEGEEPLEFQRRHLGAHRQELSVRSGDETHRVLIDLADTSVPASFGHEPLGRIEVHSGNTLVL